MKSEILQPVVLDWLPCIILPPWYNTTGIILPLHPHSFVVYNSWHTGPHTARMCFICNLRYALCSQFVIVILTSPFTTLTLSTHRFTYMNRKKTAKLGRPVFEAGKHVGFAPAEYLHHTKLVLTTFVRQTGWSPDNFEQVQRSGRPSPSLKFVAHPWSLYDVYEVRTQLSSFGRTYWELVGVMGVLLWRGRYNTNIINDY